MPYPPERFRPRSSPVPVPSRRPQLHHSPGLARLRRRRCRWLVGSSPLACGRCRCCLMPLPRWPRLRACRSRLALSRYSGWHVSYTRGERGGSPLNLLLSSCGPGHPSRTPPSPSAFRQQPAHHSATWADRRRCVQDCRWYQYPS